MPFVNESNYTVLLPRKFYIIRFHGKSFDQSFSNEKFSFFRGSCFLPLKAIEVLKKLQNDRNLNFNF